MPNLREIIDGTTIVAAGIAPPKAKSKSSSPMVKHISDHVQDPVGATKEGFGKLQRKKLEYDQERENMQRELSPVQSVINHVSQIHNLTPNAGVSPLTDPMMMDPGQDPMNPQGMVGQDPNNPAENDNPDMDENGDPANMNQTIGKMNQSRPSLAGHQPGVAPGDGQTVRPPKMGVPKPGQGNAGSASGSPGTKQYGKPAAPPKGSGKVMPKAPGSKQVADKNKKAQNNSSRQIKVNVSASAFDTSIPVLRASSTIDRHLGFESLRAAGTSVGGKKNWSTRGKGHLSKKEKKAHHDTMDSMMMPSARPSGGMRPSGSVGSGGPSRFNRPSGNAKPLLNAKKMKAGPSELSDKVNDSSAELAYNPTGGVMRSGGKHMKGCKCAKCKMNAKSA